MPIILDEEFILESCPDEAEFLLAEIYFHKGQFGLADRPVG